jgi:hypothetical protein
VRKPGRIRWWGDIYTYLCTSILPNVNEIRATSISSGDAANASSMARISSIP